MLTCIRPADAHRTGCTSIKAAPGHLLYRDALALGPDQLTAGSAPSGEQVSQLDGCARRPMVNAKIAAT